MKSKTMKSLVLVGTAIMLTFGMSVSSFAADACVGELKNSEGIYSIDMDDTALAGAAHISSETYIENGRMITVDVYKQQDGTIITDTFERSATAMLSKEGTDTATRSRHLNGWGSISITASFKWYTQGNFSYVTCLSMNASHDLDKDAVLSKWEESYTEDFVSVGAAKASVKYSMYNSKFPAQSQKGTFTITCTDEGKISDNG